jgi:hypothetical protein
MNQISNAFLIVNTTIAYFKIFLKTEASGSMNPGVPPGYIYRPAGYDIFSGNSSIYLPKKWLYQI